jgi:hypothetical protein
VRIGMGGFGTDITADGKWAMILLPGDSAGKVRIVPVGPGQEKVLHWEGVQPLWAEWYPDGKHILLNAIAGQGRGFYVTDVDGAAPKLLTTGFVPRAGVAPDGHTLVLREHGVMGIRLDSAEELKAIPGFAPGEIAASWTTDPKHLFVQVPDPMGVAIAKLDVQTGQREPWQVIHPKEQIGLRPMVNPTSITPDGRSMVFAYGTDLGQLYRSDNLH